MAILLFYTLKLYLLLDYTLILHLVLLLRDIRFNIVTNIYEATLDITAPKIFILGISLSVTLIVEFGILI